MEDKLLNKMINIHMKNFANHSQILKHKTLASEHKTNITTTSISREVSDTQLKKGNTIKPEMKTNIHMSRSSERVEKKKIENRSKEKFARKNINTGKNGLKKIAIIKRSDLVENKETSQNKKKISTINKSIDSKIISKEMNTNTTCPINEINGFSKKGRNHNTNKTSSCILFDRNSIKNDRSYRKSVVINDTVIRNNSVNINN
jgi:hypothetical protein